MSKSRGSPRKFAEKIALLNKKEAEGTAEFVRILEEVKKETTRGPSPQPLHNRHHLLQNHHQQQQQQQQKQYWGLPTRSSSFSSRQTCARQSSIYQPQVQQQQQQQQQNQNRYLAEPVLYNQNNHVQQHQQPHVDCSSNSGSNLYVDPQHHHQQQQQQVPQQTAYVEHHQTLAQQLHHQLQHNEQNHNQSRQHTQHQQQPNNQHLTINTTATTIASAITNRLNSTGNQQINLQQPTSVEVPNIEIFPIDDEHQNYSQQQMTSAQNSPDSHLSSDHYRQDCSPPSISSSRSLPNIANLSVSPTSTTTSGISTTGQFVPQMLSNQQLRSLAQAVSATNISSNHLITNAKLTPVISTSNDNSLDNYATHSPQMNDYFANDEYCSLPEIQEPLDTTTTTTINRNDLGRQSQQTIGTLNDGSWQHMATSSAPCSAAPTPPAPLVQSPDYIMSQQPSSNGQASMEQQHSSNGEQHHLHQEYYSTNSNQNQQGQIVRRSSTNVIDSIHKQQQGGDLLNAPSTNNNLSKSFEAHYGGYLEDYMTSDNFTSSAGATTTLGNGIEDNYGQSNHFELSGGSGVGSDAIRSANPISRSRSYNDIDQNFQPNDCKRTTMMPTQYSNQHQIGAQFIDTQQQYNQFYE